MRTGFRAALILSAMLAVSSCRDTAEQYFELSGRLFVFNYRVATVRYLLTLNPLKPVGDNEFAVTTFENPAGGAPMVVRQKLWPEHRKVTIESPPLECVVKDRPYSVSIRIEGEGGAVLQEIKTTMVSTQDQSMLPDRPLVVGSLYTPNPELAGHPDGRLPGGRGVTCPAGK